MKNITLSMPEDLLRKSREYAKRHGTSLNDLVRSLLRQTVSPTGQDPVNRLVDHMQDEKLQVSTKGWKWNRADLYDRKVLS